jgi:hypothetical protein
MKKLVVLALMLVPILAFAQAKEERGTKGGLPYFKATETLTEQGKVIAINAKTRDVTILIAKGDTVIVTCGPEVKNFPQIKKGDVVKTKYTETLVVHVQESGTPTLTRESSTAEAEKGAKPSGTETERLQFSATITGIDKAKGTAMLKGYRGNEYEITPRDRATLDKVKVGQLVVFTYEEAAAAWVEPVKPAKSAKPAAKK